jgi:hypothetical protein
MHIIIGAGIAGCYIAMQLKQRGEPYVLLDMSEKPHSKIETTKEGDKTLEMGASIFHSKQPKLMRFLKYLKLDHLAKPLPSSGTVRVCDAPTTSFDDMYERVRTAALIDPTSLLTVQEVSKNVLTPDEYRQFKCGYDIWWEIKYMNAYVMFSTPEDTYMMLEGGLKQVMKTAWSLLQPKTVQQVTSVDYRNEKYIVQTKDNTVFEGTKLYVCVSPENLPQIQWNTFSTEMKQLYNLVDIFSSIRYYIILNEPVQTNNRYTVGNIIGHWWIQVAPHIFMLYTDGEAADQLNSLSDQEIIDTFVQQCNVLYNSNLQAASSVKRTIRGYWPTAFEVLRPEYYTTTVDVPFVVTSIPSPEGQAWMEGHLYDLDEDASTTTPIVKTVSGVEMYQSWKLDSQIIHIFGEDHHHGPRDGCQSCKEEQGCYTFMTFLEKLQRSRPVNLYVELSYVNEKVAIKDMPTLAIIPKVFEKSNITELRQKHLRCIWSFAEPPLDLQQTCSLHNVETYASDLRLEKVFEETKSTLEYTRFTRALKDLYQRVDTGCDRMTNEELQSLLNQDRDIFVQLFNNPGVLLYQFIVEEASQAITSSILGKTYRKLVMRKRMNDKVLKTMIGTLVRYYDESKAPDQEHGVDVRRWLLNNLMLQPKPVYDCNNLTKYLFLYISSYGTIVTDLFIIMQCLLHHSETNIILTGTFHSKVYVKIMESLGAELLSSGSSTSSYCVEVTGRSSST